MKRLRRAAVIADLVDRLHAHDSWAGETHIQKASFIAQEMLQVPTGIDFELFKHGPFSFQLREELGEMRAEEILTLKAQRPPYGPRFYTDEAASQLRRRFPKTLREYREQLEWTADWLGPRGVVLLERTATAFWVTREAPNGASVEERAKRLNRLKPHFDLESCAQAVEEIDEILETAPILPTV